MKIVVIGSSFGGLAAAIRLRAQGHEIVVLLSWFYMVYSSIALTGRVLPVRDTERSKAAWAFSAGAILTAWDVAMDPAMSSATTHWQ